MTVDKKSDRKWTSTPKLKDLYPDAALAVVIGRFQPFHNGHLELVKKAFEIAPEVLVLVGSSQIARDIKNPFTFSERQDMIWESFKTPQTNHLSIEPIIDD